MHKYSINLSNIESLYTNKETANEEARGLKEIYI